MLTHHFYPLSNPVNPMTLQQAENQKKTMINPYSLNKEVTDGTLYSIGHPAFFGAKIENLLLSLIIPLQLL